MADTGRDENMQDDSASHHASCSSRPAGKEGSLKHRILSRPAGGCGSSDESRSHHSSSNSNSSTPIPSPSSSHSDRMDSTTSIIKNTPTPPPKKRPRMSDRNSDSSSSTPHSDLSKSTNSTPTGMASRSAASTPNRSPHLYQPNQFNRGSLIRLANGELKAIEAMSSEDFVQSAAASPNLRVQFSEVARVERHLVNGKESTVLHFRIGNRNSSEVAVEACEDHPFFVHGKGWSSTSPAATQARFGLRVAQLLTGDTCVSLSYRETQTASGSSTAPVDSGRLQERNSRTISHETSTPSPHTSMAVDPRTFALSTSDLASFRRWSAPEDDRFLDNLPK